MVSNIIKFLESILSLFKPLESSTPISSPISSPVPIPVPIPVPSIPDGPITISQKKKKIQEILNVFETGSIKGDYSAVSIYKDGPNDIKQITYGKSQTTEWGNLSNLIQRYSVKNGKFSNFFMPYISKIGKVSLVYDTIFIDKLKEAGTDIVMKQVQDEFFDDVYWKPAMKFVNDNKFVFPLSGLVIYDSYIHSGGIPVFLRNKFSEVPPSKGGDEKQWIEQYLNTRQKWLANHSRPILRKTIYRTKNMLVALKQNDWDLTKPFNANGVIHSDNSLTQSKTIQIVIQ